MEFVARQPGVPASDLGFYEWSGHTSEYHRAQVRRHFWFRECSAEDGGKLTEWLAASVCPAEPPGSAGLSGPEPLQQVAVDDLVLRGDHAVRVTLV